MPNINTIGTEGKAENLPALKQLLKENPDQDFIWAHVGAAVTQSVPDNYPELVREMLAEHPNLKIDTSWDATADMMAGRKLGDSKSKPVDDAKVQQWAEVIADHPDRFLWGSDNIAASQNKALDQPQDVLKYFGSKDHVDSKGRSGIGLLEKIEKAGKDRGNPEALEKFLSGNFEEYVAKAADRTGTFRTDPKNREWLANGGPSDANGRVPPKQWVRKETGEYEFVESASLPNGGNRETYDMPDDAAPSDGQTMIWQPDGKGGYVQELAGGRQTGTFPPNPNRTR